MPEGHWDVTGEGGGLAVTPPGEALFGGHGAHPNVETRGGTSPAGFVGILSKN